MMRHFRAAVLVSVLLVISYFVLVTLGVGNRNVFGNIDQCLTAAAAAVACWITAGLHPPKVRLAWRLMAVSATAYAGGQITYTYLQLFSNSEVPFPAPSDIGYSAAIPFAALAIATFVRTPSGRIARLRALLEGALLAASALFLGWAFILGPVHATSDVGALGNFISLYYPTGDVVVISMLLYAASRNRRGTRSTLGLIGVGLALIAFSDSSYSVLSVHGDYYTGSPTDTGWFLGYLIIALAALRIRPSEPEESPTERRGRLTRVTAYLPYLPLAAAVVLVATGVIDPRSDSVLAWLAITSVALMAMLQVAAVADNSRLTAHLEDRVEERTRQLHQQEQFLRSIVQNSSEVVTVVDDRLVVFYQTSVRTRGHGAREVDFDEGASLLDGFDESQHQHIEAIIDSARDQPGAVLSTEVTQRVSEAEVITLEFTVVNLLLDPRVNGIVVTTSDISVRKALEHQLTHQAFHDTLTQLPNRALFSDRLTHALARFQRSADSPLAVLFIDLDDFKSVNDSLGHALGDKLLHVFSDRVHGLLRPQDTFARLGGDEFALLLEDTSIDSAVAVSERILQSMLLPFAIDGREIFVNVSIGIASSDTAVSSEELQRNADVAMYRAKSAGRGGFRVYEPEMHDEAVARLELESGLRRALDNEEFVVHYQPQIDMVTGYVLGVEALVRWQHPETGLVPPDKFIPIAEDTGLILGIGRWVLRQACAQGVRWMNELGDRAPYVSVNLSYRQLQHDDIIADIASTLFETGLPASRLMLEMTESVLADDSAQAKIRLDAIKELGVRLSIDDFGKGYSSLSYLREFPFDELKIDRRFINAITSSTADIALVQAVLDLGKLFTLNTVAEGIETVEQRDKLREMGCVVGQGYLFSRPLPVEQVDALLRTSTQCAPGESIYLA